MHAKKHLDAVNGSHLFWTWQREDALLWHSFRVVQPNMGQLHTSSINSSIQESWAPCLGNIAQDFFCHSFVDNTMHQVYGRICAFLQHVDTHSGYMMKSETIVSLPPNRRACRSRDQCPRVPWGPASHRTRPVLGKPPPASTLSISALPCDAIKSPRGAEACPHKGLDAVCSTSRRSAVLPRQGDAGKM